MDTATQHALAITAAKARLLLTRAVFRAGCGHPGGSLSCTDYLTVLYNRILRADPANPDDPGRDRFVLSKGHAAPALYAILSLKGYFGEDEVLGFRQIDSRLSGHPDMTKTPGVDMSTGSLGQGFSAAVGMAMAAKLDKAGWRVYTLLGDGEVEEGQVWEAAMAAAKFGLDNLCAAVDVNGLQIDGRTADVMPSEPLDEKFASFGWHVISIDGHDLAAIEDALLASEQVKGKPTMILMRTVKGKGVSYMENNADWHGKAPNAEEFAVAESELLAKLAELEA
ncbi:MAG: transketolase [Oscillospiraceae bacterium]|nr:transketolase [Oscillospiraceae bacterium]